MHYFLSITHNLNLLVKPDATPEEVRAVVNDENGGQIFSQAVGVLIYSFKQNLICILVDELQPIRRIKSSIPGSTGATPGYQAYRANHCRTCSAIQRCASWHSWLSYLLIFHNFQMSMLVEQQDETINTIQATAEVVEKDMETG